MKKLLAAMMVLVLLAGCVAGMEPPTEETTTQAPATETTLFSYSHATAAIQSNAEITLAAEMQICSCGGNLDSICEFAEHLATRPSAAPLNITDVPSDEFMAQFNNIHTITFERPHWVTHDIRNWLVFWTDEVLHDFSFMRIGIHSWDQSWAEIGLPYYAHEIQLTIEEFLPGDAFVLQDWFGPYQHPTAGFTFIDQSSEQRYMFFLQSMMDGRFFLQLFENNPPPNN